MSREIDCRDSSVAESFFVTLKEQLVHPERYATGKEAEASIFEYVEVLHKRRHLHSTSGYTSSVEHRHNNAALATSE